MYFLAFTLAAIYSHQPAHSSQRPDNWQAERAAAEATAEDAFRAATLARMAEDDRVEQMNAQRRRMRMAEHRREVEELIAGKRAAFERAQVLKRHALVESLEYEILRLACNLSLRPCLATKSVHASAPNELLASASSPQVTNLQQPRLPWLTHTPRC